MPEIGIALAWGWAALAARRQRSRPSLAAWQRGTVFSLTRMLGSSSTLALIAGTNGNLTLAGTVIRAAAALGRRARWPWCARPRGSSQSNTP